MSEFFLELFSEEIPSRLQINARNELTQIFKKFFDNNEIIVKGKINTYSTPNRLIVHINKIPKDVIKKAEEIRGPNINCLLYTSPSPRDKTVSRMPSSA